MTTTRHAHVKNKMDLVDHPSILMLPKPNVRLKNLHVVSQLTRPPL
jgi:hypothetical protein